MTCLSGLDICTLLAFSVIIEASIAFFGAFRFRFEANNFMRRKIHVRVMSNEIRFGPEWFRILEKTLWQVMASMRKANLPELLSRVVCMAEWSVPK